MYDLSAYQMHSHTIELLLKLMTNDKNLPLPLIFSVTTKLVVIDSKDDAIKVQDMEHPKV